MDESPATEKRPEMNELDLIRRAQLEDTSAYEELVRRYYGKIYGLVYGMTSSREDAEDVTKRFSSKPGRRWGIFVNRPVFIPGSIELRSTARLISVNVGDGAKHYSSRILIPTSNRPNLIRSFPVKGRFSGK